MSTYSFNFRRTGATQSITPNAAANTPVKTVLNNAGTGAGNMRVFNSSNQIVWILFQPSVAADPSAIEMQAGIPLAPGSVETLTKNAGIDAVFIMTEAANATGKVYITPGLGN